MRSKLVFLDIDGTLTQPGMNIPPDSALRAMARAREKGHKLFLCTGRNYHMLLPVLRYGFDGAVASSGGYVFTGEKVLFDCPMSRQQLELGMKLLGDKGVLRTIEAKNGNWADMEQEQAFAEATGGNSEFLRWRRVISEKLDIRPMQEYDGSPVYKIVFICREDSQLLPARKALEQDFHFLMQDMPAFQCVNGEMVNRLFDKGRGVRIMSEYFGMPLEDTIGFGDSMNDLEMMETVGYSVCMENGSPRLKEECDMVCPAVDADGLAWAFEKLGLV